MDSTGRQQIAQQLLRVWAEVRGQDAGQVSTVYDALALADPEQFGLAVVSVSGALAQAGDASTGFGLMSVAKPFTFALVCAAIGVDQAASEIGMEATAAAFNDLAPVLANPGGRTNPMVNSGAIATCSRIPGASLEEKWAHLASGLSAFAGRPLTVDETLHANVASTNVRNQQLAHALASQGALACAPDDALALYTRQSCLRVTAVDLGVMGATLANHGVNPVTGAPVVSPQVCPAVLAAMTIAGMYERSGEWLYRVGLPAKSGLGGGIVTIAPGRGALGAFSPRLDATGNSVRAGLASELVVGELGWGLFE